MLSCLTQASKTSIIEMTTEELIREMISKMCPFHGKKAIIVSHASGQIDISACCKEFQIFLETLKNDRSNRGIDEVGSCEATRDLQAEE